MKKMAKAAALIAAMVLAAGLTACQKKESAGGSGAIKVSAKDAEKAAGYLIMDGTTVMGYKEGLPAKLVIPAGVTEIGKEAFDGCESLKSVVIQDGVTSIGESAFSGCTSLASVVIPTSVTSIGGYAFCGCRSLTSVVVPEGVTSIGDGAFLSCRSLTSVTIADSVTEIGWSVFNECTSLTSVTIPASVTKIGNHAFEECESLKEVKYAGTKAQWEAIKKGDDIGYGFVVTCTDGAVRI